MLEISYDQYYIPAEIQDNLKLNKTPVYKQPNAVEALFINDGITSYNDSQDFFKIMVSDIEDSNIYTEDIKMLVPEGLRDVLSIDTETTTRLCLGYNVYSQSVNCQLNYKGKIRAMVSKMPAFLFSKFRQVMYFATIVISDVQYAEILQQVLQTNSYMRGKYDELIAEKNYTNGVPKIYLLVKLKEGIDDQRRKYLSNGIRSFFTDELTFLVDMKELLASISSSVSQF